MTRRLIDLSHVVEHGMTTYPGQPGPVVSDHLTREDSRSHYAPGTEFHIGRIEMIANTGTYLDTPAHRYPDGIDLSELPLESVAALDGILVRAPAGERALGPEVLDGREITGCAVLFHTGWDRHWRTDAYGNGEHPFLTADCAAALVDRGATLAGIDSLNIDATATGERPVHSALLAAGIPIVEHLTGLDQLAEPFTFFAVPVRVRGLGTFPVRAFALRR